MRIVRAAFLNYPSSATPFLLLQQPLLPFLVGNMSNRSACNGIWVSFAIPIFHVILLLSLLGIRKAPSNQIEGRSTLGEVVNMLLADAWIINTAHAEHGRHNS